MQFFCGVWVGITLVLLVELMPFLVRFWRNPDGPSDRATLRLLRLAEALAKKDRAKQFTLLLKTSIIESQMIALDAANLVLVTLGDDTEDPLKWAFLHEQMEAHLRDRREEHDES